MASDRDAAPPYAANPLWRWRIANRREAREVETWLRLPVGRVEEWEQGRASPTRRELRALARWTGIADMEAQWSAWRGGPSTAGRVSEGTPEGRMAGAGGPRGGAPGGRVHPEAGQSWWEQPVSREGWNSPLPEHLPNRTSWQVATALGTVLLFWGVVTSWLIAAVGVVLLGVSVAGWIKELRIERYDHE